MHQTMPKPGNALVGTFGFTTAVLLSVVGPLFMASCQQQTEPWSERAGPLYYNISASIKFSPADRTLADAVWRYLEDADNVFNDFRENSEIGRLNRMTDRRDVLLSDDLARAFRLALVEHPLTDGAFDVSLGPLRDLWRKAARDGVMPTDAAVQDTLSACGMKGVRLDGRSLSVDNPATRFDFGGLKGVIVDRAMEMLRAHGVRAALVQIGGETAAFGLSAKGKTHLVGIQHPLDLQKLYTSVRDPGTGLSLSTSGNYRQPLMIGNKAYYHIFDPRTGRPVDTHVLSVTVAFLTPDKTGMADALCKAGAVLGADAALPLIEKQGGEALFLLSTESGGIREQATKGWRQLEIEP